MRKLQFFRGHNQPSNHLYLATRQTQKHLDQSLIGRAIHVQVKDSRLI